MKACEQCAADRVSIGCNHKQMSLISRAIGMVFVYLPILTLPFVITSAYLTYYSLVFCGAKNLKKWGDYIPEKTSYRYNLKNQITMEGSYRISIFSQAKLFWILNCTFYCPYSVALFEWHTYLVKVVENWWCPFTHEKKGNYKNGSIDNSFWHIYPEDASKLHEDDLNNPIYTDQYDHELEEHKK